MTASPPAHAPPDAAQLQGRELPRAEFPGRARGRFRVFLDPSVHAKIHRHAREHIDVEVCGVLVGAWKRDDDGPFVAITARIPGEAAASKFAEVTFTHETWAAINKRMDTEFADLAIVGWYHTHPDFGVFLSDRDRFIHEHFFSEPGQVAFVVDPVRAEEGFFVWAAGKPVLCPHHWVGSDLKAGPVGNPGGAGSAAMNGERGERGAAGRDHAHQDDSRDPRPAERFSWLTILTGVVALLAGYLLAGQRSAWEQERLAEGALAHYGVLKVLKPGLGEALDSLDAVLATIAGDLRSAAGSKPGSEPASTDRDRAIAQLAEVRRGARTIRDIYALTPSEAAMVEKVVLAESTGLTVQAGPTPPPSGSAAPPGGPRK
jgi:proteasome lid subunit RPN8/RPN11